MTTALQKVLVQISFDKLPPNTESTAHIFYEKLFELDSTLRPLFKNDMKLQGQNLMSALSLAVSKLNNMEGLMPILEDLGRLHAAHDVKLHHYDTVGEALIWTLGEALGDDFTTDVKTAWIEVYDDLSTVMKNAVYKPVEMLL